MGSCDTNWSISVRLEKPSMESGWKKRLKSVQEPRCLFPTCDVICAHFFSRHLFAAFDHDLWYIHFAFHTVIRNWVITSFAKSHAKFFPSGFQLFLEQQGSQEYNVMQKKRVSHISCIHQRAVGKKSWADNICGTSTSTFPLLLLYFWYLWQSAGQSARQSEYQLTSQMIVYTKFCSIPPLLHFPFLLRRAFPAKTPQWSEWSFRLSGSVWLSSLYFFTGTGQGTWRHPLHHSSFTVR